MAEGSKLGSGDVGSFSDVAATLKPNSPASSNAIGQTAERVAPVAATHRERSFVRHALEPEPPGVRYDADLERLCRIAASVGGEQVAPLSYTALVIAFLFGDDKVSVWFRSYVQDRKIRVDDIFRSKSTSAESQDMHVSRAESGVLPDVTPLYSRSVRNVMEQAARIARDIQSVESSNPILGPCHVMAAYAFRNPSDHRDQVRGWGFEESDWQEQFLHFAQQTFPDEQWSRLKGFVRPYVEAVSSFTSDDPLAPAGDLLGVEDEAAAFARIAAASSIKPPLAIGIFGEWGSGKTFFMRRIYENVEALTRRAATRPNQTLFHSDIVQIRFNAWHYIETNLWASLVEYIFTELDRWLLDKTQNVRPEADLVFNRLATAQQLKLDALESVVTRRAERRSAELRAERARREYEHALARSAAVGAGTYARAFLDTFLAQDEVKGDLVRIGKALGAPELAGNAGRVVEVLEQGRSEAGRARLLIRAGTEKLGTWPWIVAVVSVLLVVPLLVVGFKDFVAWLTNSAAIASIHDTVLALASLAAGVAACGGTLVQRASKVLQEVDAFDKRLRERIAQQVQASDDPARKLAAEDELRKRRQEMEAAERALAEADVRLTAARQDFESATARSRLNAFIRAKATEGDYAKHLGIIAAIRRDFGQLATLMGAANDSDDQRAESRRLANEAKTRVTRFLDWLADEQEVRLTPGELRSLLSLLDPAEAVEVLTASREMLTLHLEGTAMNLDSLQTELEGVRSKELPRFSRIILYIDDLDRCPPDTVVKVLQAVHLLLTFPLFTVVVAVDARWVSRALREEFPKMLAETGMFAGNGDATGGAGASSHDYLEKIFQIPYWVRPIDEKGAKTYVNSLVDADVRRVANVTKPSEADPDAPDANSGDSAQPALEAHSKPSTADDRPSQPSREEREATSLELTRWEADALERFAPLVGATPRRLIRFVNVYRLIKTSLPATVLERFVGTEGESETYRALVTQLAIVTGAPDACQQYFTVIEEVGEEETLAVVIERLEADPAFQARVDHETVQRILALAQDPAYGAQLKISHLRVSAPITRRYSFTARPH